MAGPAARELKIGMIVEGTLGVLERCMVPALIFVVVVGLINAAATYYGLAYTTMTQQLAKGLFSMTISIVASYALLHTMLRKLGFLPQGTEDAFLPYIGLSVLYTLGVGLGFILIILPGLFLMARWSVASPLLLVRGKGVIKAMKDSWEQTKGNEFPIIIAVVLLMILFVGISFGAGIVFGPEDPVGLVIGQIASAIGSAIGIALGVALYRLIVIGRDEEAVQTFA